MRDFLVNSVIASIALTALINVIPRLFPGTSAEARIRELVGEDHATDQHETGPRHGTPAPGAERPALRIWFPWKQMLVWSMIITITINVLQLID